MNPLNEYLDSNIDDLIGLLEEIISFKTVAPPGNCYHEVVDYLIPIFTELGFQIRKLVMPAEVFEAKCNDPRLVGDRVNLIASRDAGASETLVIYTHLDVVPPGDNWSTDPFKLEIIDERAYGRGVSDSKGAVAGLIAALKAVTLHGKLKYNLNILLTTDEEVGGYSGLCHLADSGLVRGDKMLCMDGFSDDVVIGSNGVINWRITVSGISAHSGSSFLGINAIEKSLPIIEGLMDKKREVESVRSTLAASSALRELGITCLMPVLNITMINAGIKENIVPDRCVIRGDRRVIPEERMEDAAAEIEDLVTSIDPDVELRLWPGYPPMRMNPDHPWIAEVREAVRRTTGTLPRISGTQGSLDQAYASDVTHIPAAVFGVGRQIESNIHGADENIRIADLMNFSKFLAALLSDDL